MNMNALELLAEVVQNRNWYAGLEIDRRLAGEYKRNLVKGKVSYGKACQLLESLGFSKVKEETWKIGMMP